VVGGVTAGATALCLGILWMLRRRKEASHRLSVRIERPSDNTFRVVVEYTPEQLNQAHFVDVGSLGSNPIYLLPKLHYGLPDDTYDDHIANLTWPKTAGQWTGGRLRPVAGLACLRAEFRVVPRSTDAPGWLYVRVYTKGPRLRTVLMRRVPVSIVA
jgi:hypothetical protein